MDWKEEAKSIIKDVQPFVTSISLNNSNSEEVELEIATLEQQKLTVILNKNGFRIQVCTPSEERIQVGKQYETIESLLSENSPEYKRTFAMALSDRINSIQS